MPDRWIFFDCFNTLIDDFDPQTGDISGVGGIAGPALAAGYFADAPAFRAAYEAKRADNWGAADGDEISLDLRLAAVLQDAKPGGDSAQHVAVVQDMLAELKCCYPDEVRPVPGVPDMLARVQQGYRLGVVSNFFLPDWPAWLLGLHGLVDAFEFVIDSAQLGCRKPDARIYQAALQQAGMQEHADQVLFVGDCLLRDVQAPRQHGMRAQHRDRSADRPGVQASPEADAIRDWQDFLCD